MLIDELKSPLRAVGYLLAHPPAVYMVEDSKTSSCARTISREQC